MSELHIGIDPGCSGAIVVLDHNFDYVDHMLMPLLKIGKSSRVNGTAVAAFLRKFDLSRASAYIEQVGSMPGQGVASTFTFGHAAGVVEGVVSALGISITKIAPQTWKKRAELIGKDKDAARSRAILLYPELRELDLKAKGQAIADAILIARYTNEQKRRSLI